MGLFDFLKRNKATGLPDQYKGLISAKDYELVLATAVRYHQENGFNIIRVGEGTIVTRNGVEDQHRHLDNLIRILPSYEKVEWPKVIYEHFDKIKDHRVAYDYFSTDFSSAAELLRVLIKHEELYEGALDQMVCRCDFPGTNTFLVLEFEQQFKYLTRKDIRDWNKTEGELFRIAIANTPGDEVQARKTQYAERFPLFVFLGGDFSASLMLDLPARVDAAVGTYGTLIAIPTKGTAFAHPIETKDILELVKELAPTIDKFYHEDPGNITRNFYWMFGDEIEVLPYRDDENGRHVRLPPRLLDML